MSFWYSFFLPLALAYSIPAIILSLIVARGVNCQFVVALVVPAVSAVATWLLMWKAYGMALDGWRPMIMLFVLAGLSPVVFVIFRRTFNIESTLTLGGMLLLSVPSAMLAVVILAAQRFL